jgi:predicted kinase
MIIAMAGLPGTGKSTLARALGTLLQGAVIDKDVVRSALFPGAWTDYSTTQDDFVLKLMMGAAEWLITQQRCPTVLIDGRTFSQAYQLEVVRQVARRLEQKLLIVECICEPAVAIERILRDAPNHPAKNRDADLYWNVRRIFEPIPAPKVVVNTTTTVDCLELATRLRSPVAE